MTKPLVSVVVPVHNGERFLTFALQSIFAQDYQPLEVIVVDDGSEDGSAAIARSFAALRYLHQPHQGVATARNMGLSASSGEFVAFLDQDDLWTPNKLTAQIRSLLEQPHLGYSIAYVRHFLEPGTFVPQWLKPELLTTDCPGYFLGNLVARTTVFQIIGVFDPTFQMGSDSDWFARAKDAGVPMAVLPETLLLKRVHSSNHSHETDRGAAEILRLLKASLDRRQTRKKEGQDAAR